MSETKQTGISEQFKHDQQQLIGFTIGGNLFGADIATVHEIVRSAPLTEMPNAPDYVEGLMKMRGNIFPLINLRKKMRLEEEGGVSGDTWIIVLEIQGMLTGIRVDTVTRVLEINREDIIHADDAPDTEIDAAYCRGIYPEGDRHIILPDFERIFLLNT